MRIVFLITMVADINSKKNNHYEDYQKSFLYINLALSYNFLLNTFEVKNKVFLSYIQL